MMRDYYKVLYTQKSDNLDKVKKFSQTEIITFGKIDESTLTHHHHPKSGAYPGVQSWCCTFYGFRQMYNQTVVLMVKNLPAIAGDVGDVGSIPRSGRSPGKRAWQSTPVSLPRESHRQRSPVHPKATVHWVANS